MQLVLSSDFAAAIGRVVVNFGLLESAVGMCVAGLAAGEAPGEDFIWPPTEDGGEDARIVGEILTSGSSFRRNVEMFACLQRLRHPGWHQDAFEDLLSTLFLLDEERNKVVHSLWSDAGDGKAERYKVTSRSKGHKVSKDLVPLADLQKLAEDIAAACARLSPYMFGGNPDPGAIPRRLGEGAAGE
jgi:hypothetical protein